ncbi:MAG: DUF445 domain-containing protein [Gemmatimonadaceae bacterium]|nr:DUF445 domain-containing protein [Gemmatimonadaceae bacterium]
MTYIPLPPTPDDSEKAQRLAAMKRRATGLLVFVTVVFVVARLYESRHPSVGWVRAMAEAAMVGGLADWFAVTALFRYPMGIPIPHTAIIPNRKERIGRSLGNFLQSYFLRRDVLERRLAGLGLSRRIMAWAALPENAPRIAHQLAQGLARAAEVVPADEMKTGLHNTLVAQGRKVHVAPLLGQALLLVAADNRHQRLLDRVLELVQRLLTENRELIRQRIATESPWWVPTAIDDKLYAKLVNGTERIIWEVATQPDHQLRRQFDRILGEYVEGLRDDPEVIGKAERMKERLLEQPVVEELAGALWESTQRALIRYASPDAGAPQPLERGIITAAEAALKNDALLAEIDEAINKVVLGAVEQYRHEIAAVIERTVAEWDPKDASQRIEIAVGRDLQFIRINGTIVGGLVGLLLYAFSHFIG